MVFYCDYISHRCHASPCVSDTRHCCLLPQARKRVIIVASLDGDCRDILLSSGPVCEKPCRRPCHECHAHTGTGGALLRAGYCTSTSRLNKVHSKFGCAPTLTTGNVESLLTVVLNKRVSLVTPRGAMKLQGFTSRFAKQVDHWFDGIAGKPCPKLTRAKAVCNAVPLPIARWLGAQLAQVMAQDRYCGGGQPMRPGKWTCAGWGGPGIAPMDASSPMKTAGLSLLCPVRFNFNPISKHLDSDDVQGIPRVTLSQWLSKLKCSLPDDLHATLASCCR